MLWVLKRTFEHQKHTFKPMDKKIMAILRLMILHNWPYVCYSEVWLLVFCVSSFGALCWSVIVAFPAHTHLLLYSVIDRHIYSWTA